VPSAQRRKRVWARNTTAIDGGVAAGVASDLLAGFQTAAGLLAPPPGVTIGGILLDYTIVQTNARAAAEDGLFVGIIVTSEPTQLEVPRPIGEPHADWMWYQYIPAPGAAAGASVSTAVTLGGPLRLRAKRRMDEIGMHLWLVAQPQGLTTYDTQFVSSTLLMMP